MNARIERLRAEVAHDRQVLAVHLDELERVPLAGPPFEPGEVARVAIAVDHAYSAVEAILARVARTIEGDVPEGRSWHQALLEASALELEGIRPALVSPASLPGLRRLLGFRHFFRHAYAAPLEGAPLRDLRDVARDLRAPLDADLARVESWLRALASAG